MQWKLSVIVFVVSGMLLMGQSITVTRPNGGENWVLGSTEEITWTTEDISSGTFQITLWEADQNLGVVVTGLPHTQESFPWIVGKLINAPDADPGSNYRIKIRHQENPSNDFSDAPFSIRSASSIVIPDGDIARPPRPRLFCDLQLKGNVSIAPKPRHTNEPLFMAFQVTAAGNTGSPASRVLIRIQGPEGYSTREFTHNLDPMPKGTGRWVQQKFHATHWGIYRYIVTLDDGDQVAEGTAGEANNDHSGHFSVDPLPDLQAYIRPLVPTVSVGVKRNITAEIKNIGQTESPPATLRFYIEDKGTKTYNVPRLEPGEVHQVSRKPRWSTRSLRHFSIHVDPANAVEELREDNNVHRGTVDVRLPTEFAPDGAAGLADLKPVIHGGMEVHAREKVTFRIVITNISNNTKSDPCPVHLTVSDKGTKIKQIPGLFPGESHEILHHETWDTSGVRKLTIHIDPNRTISENWQNNRSSRSVNVLE